MRPVVGNKKKLVNDTFPQQFLNSRQCVEFKSILARCSSCCLICFVMGTMRSSMEVTPMR